MSAYMFAPCPDLSTNEQNFAYWENGFSEEELNKICEIGDCFLTHNAKIYGNNENEIVRKSKVAWLYQNEETNFIYDKMAYITRMLNGQFFDFDLYGFVEDFQYTTYLPENNHYDWHMDKGSLGCSPRKLSLVLQLTDPAEYEGGDLQFKINGDDITARKERGLVYAFPSWILHRVTPVTKGIRKTLVIWVAGPKFR